MTDFQSLNNLPEINFKAKDRPALKELADYVDKMKADLFDDRWSQATKKHIKGSLVLYIRTIGTNRISLQSTRIIAEK